MTAFDPAKYQLSPNGPFSPATVKRMVAVKERSGMAYATLGAKLGISGTFLHNLINKDANIGTQHVQRIVKALELLENPESAMHAEGGATLMLQHSFHLRPDLQITMVLPGDLTDREAERLAQFVQALPVA